MFHRLLDLSSPENWSSKREELLLRGFVAFPEFASPYTVDRLTAEADVLITNATADGVYGVVQDVRGEVLVMNRIDKVSDYLFDLARHPVMMTVAERLLGKPAMSLHVEYFCKPREHSSPTPPHQDHIFYEEHFDDELAISLWIALDDVGPDSGALEYSTPSPMQLLPHIQSPAIDFDFQLTETTGFSFVQAPVPRGGCVAHHSYAVHRAGYNQSGVQRRAIAFNYRGSDYRAWLKSKDAK